jgi:hypothetical protein
VDIDAVVRRLAAYEDTGLEPEEVARLANPWISVEERLPEESDYINWKFNVLMRAGDRVLEGYHANGHWTRANSAHTNDLPPITHWMPLPGLPKKEMQPMDRCKKCKKFISKKTDFYFECGCCGATLCADCGIDLDTSCPECGGAMDDYNEGGECIRDQT